MVGGRAARLVTHRPAEDSASTVTHEDPTVVLGDAQGGDLGRVCIVLPVKGRVHGQLAPEHQLPFPPVPRLQSVVVPHFDRAGVGVVKGGLQMSPGPALRIVHKYEAVPLIEAQLVGPAPGVVGAAVIAPGGRGSARGRPGPVAGAAGLAGRVLGVLADALLLRLGIAAVLVLGFLPYLCLWTVFLHF